MTKKITAWTFLSLCLLITFGCKFNEKDASKDFECRIDYLKIRILPPPPSGLYSIIKPRPEDYCGYGDFKYDIYKTESIIRPYRAELAFAYLEKPTNQNYQVVQKYRAIFTHSTEAKSWWELVSIEEKDSEENSEWKPSSEFSWLEQEINSSKKIIRSEMKKHKEQQRKTRKLLQKFRRKSEKGGI